MSGKDVSRLCTVICTERRYVTLTVIGYHTIMEISQLISVWIELWLLELPEGGRR